MARRIQWRRDTAAAWAAINPILAAGEPGYVTDTKIFRIGDGAAAFLALDYYYNGAQAIATFVALNGGSVIVSGGNIKSLTLKASNVQTVPLLEGQTYLGAVTSQIYPDGTTVFGAALPGSGFGILTAIAPSIGARAIVGRAAASATANIFEAQNSSGSPLTLIGPGGSLQVGSSNTSAMGLGSAGVSASNTFAITDRPGATHPATFSVGQLYTINGALWYKGALGTQTQLGAA